MKSEQVVSPARPFQVQVTMAEEKKTEESSKEDQAEVHEVQGAFAASSDHNALAFRRMMGSFGARTNLIRKQVQPYLFGFYSFVMYDDSA